MTTLTLVTIVTIAHGATGARGYRRRASALGGATTAVADVVVGTTAVPTLYSVSRSSIYLSVCASLSSSPGDTGA
jgi:hypothetical protein